MIKNFFLVHIILMVFANTVKAEGIVIDLEPNDEISNNDFRDALEQVQNRKREPVILNLKLGTYYFSRQQSTKELYYVSNTTSEAENPNPVKHIALLLKDQKNVVIDGNGSTLMMTGEMTSFVIDNCESITFRNLNFDYLHPTQTEIKILDKGNDYLIAEVHPTSQYRIEDGKLEWYGDGWSFSGGIAQTYDNEKDITWRSWSPMSDLIKTTEMEKNILRMVYSKSPDANIGHVYQMRDGIRDEVCGFIHKSKDIRFENCNFYYLGNFGIVGQYSQNIIFEGVNFAPEEGSGRTNAGFADFIQISGCKGLIDINNCRFTGAHDDPINIHGTHLQVMEFIDSDKVKIRFTHPQSYGFDAFFEGDKIEFIDRQSLLSTGQAKVKNVQKINPREIILVLEKNLPSDVLNQKDLVVENITWIPDVRITNNFFSRIPTRGILVTTRGKVLIEQNTFYGMQMSAILIADDALSWYESGMVKDVTIRNNKFIECGSPVIYIEPENKVHKGAVHQNISIENNKFRLKNTTEKAIEAKSVEGLSVTSNLFIINEEPLNSIDGLVKTKDCINVNIQNNRLEASWK